MSKRRKGCIGCSGLLVAFGLLIIIIAIVDPPKKTTPVAARVASTPVPSSVAPTPGATTSSTPKASTSSPAFTMPTDPASYLAPLAVRNKAAGILHADDAYYQNEYNQGVTVILDRGSAGSYPAFSAWYQKAVTADIKPGMTAFSQANALFNAGDEPPGVSNWQGDNGTVSSDLVSLANDGLGVGGPDDSSARQQVLADEKQFQTDFATAEQDADDVAAGK